MSEHSRQFDDIINNSLSEEDRNNLNDVAKNDPVTRIHEYYHHNINEAYSHVKRALIHITEALTNGETPDHDFINQCRAFADRHYEAAQRNSDSFRARTGKPIEARAIGTNHEGDVGECSFCGNPLVQNA